MAPSKSTKYKNERDFAINIARQSSDAHYQSLAKIKAFIDSEDVPKTVKKQLSTAYKQALAIVNGPPQAITHLPNLRAAIYGHRKLRNAGAFNKDLDEGELEEELDDQPENLDADEEDLEDNKPVTHKAKKANNSQRHTDTAKQLLADKKAKKVFEAAEKKAKEAKRAAEKKSPTKNSTVIKHVVETKKDAESHKRKRTSSEPKPTTPSKRPATRAATGKIKSEATESPESSRSSPESSAGNDANKATTLQPTDSEKEVKHSLDSKDSSSSESQSSESSASDEHAQDDSEIEAAQDNTDEDSE